MKKLSTDWFLEGTLDFEYKKYILLAYLQYVSQEFAELRLYPPFSDLIFHYNNLSTFQEKKRQLYDQFPSSLSHKDLRELNLSYIPDIEDDFNLQEIEAIVSYALPTIAQQLKEGKGIYETINEQIKIEPIGLLPLYKNEGYIFLRIYPQKSVKIFEYKVIFFENTDVNYHGISFQYIDTVGLSFSNTYEAIKLQLIRQNQKLPNPATYLLYAVKAFPEEASLVPVAKRKMLAYLKEGEQE